MILHRARSAGLPAEVFYHTFRAAGITAFLLGGPALSGAQGGVRIATHESHRTASLFDRRRQEGELEESGGNRI